MKEAINDLRAKPISTVIHNRYQRRNEEIFDTCHRNDNNAASLCAVFMDMIGNVAIILLDDVLGETIH